MKIRCPAFLIAILLPSLVLAKKDSSVISQIKSEFLNKSFTTKVLVGTAWYDPSMRTLGQTSPGRRVDTEVNENGSLRYLVRSEVLLLQQSERSGNFYVQESELHSSIPVSTSVMIKDINVKNDRLEFELGGPDVAYGKLKFMLGNGFQDRLSYEDLMQRISFALKLEEFERIQELQAKYKELKTNLAGNLDDVNRYEQSKELVAILQELSRTVPRNSQAYNNEMAGLQSSLSALENKARTERIHRLEKILTSDLEEENKIKAMISKKPGGVAEAQSQLALLDRWKQILETRKQCFADLDSLGQQPPGNISLPQELDFQKIDKMKTDLQSSRHSIQLAELDSQFAAMQKKQKLLRNAYFRAFGTSKEYAAAREVLDQLSQMLQNRIAAENAGSRTASRQREEVELEIQKMKRKL